MTVNSRSVRWLHLSDFHVGKDDYAQIRMFDYIFNHVRDRKAQGFIPDFIFLTGDLANKGLKSEYETLWLEFILPLQEIVGGDIENRTFIVPGNHDVDRKKNPAFSREDIVKADSRYFDPTTEGLELRKGLLFPRIQAYSENDFSQTKNAFLGQEGAYARVISIRGEDIGVVGINTAWLCKDDEDERRLSPGKQLLENALVNTKSAVLQIVLGHHPVDWFIPAQQKQIKSVFGQANALYLHGHLHEIWTEPTQGGGNSYLAIQAGAAFQSREDEPWRNGLVWGEADIGQGNVRLQPWRWTPDHQGWTLAADAFPEGNRRGDWWQYPLPGRGAASNDFKPTIPAVLVPKGWSVIKPRELSKNLDILGEAEALRYFDGAVPDWHIALSASIPRRGIVKQLTQHFDTAEAADRSTVTLLVSAGCEGKTTALLQAAYDIAGRKGNWRILQRRDESQPLVVENILSILDGNYFWLIVIDECDNVASSARALLTRLPEELHGRVHVLMACRDTDWLAVRGDNIDFRPAADFHKDSLSGLNLLDAQAIVDSWQAYGEQGLGELSIRRQADRAAALEKQSREEVSKKGAFFGALLAVRSGNDLRKHAKALLERLSRREQAGGHTLLDSLAYIAAMHAEGLEYLSRPVLAKAMNCPIAKLHREIIVPLGQEAGATVTSSFIFTRHSRIASTLISILEEELDYDISDIYVNLCRAAISSFQDGEFVPELSAWRFKMSSHFLESNKQELAFRISQAVLSMEPAHVPTRINAANLYRRVGRPEEAVRLLSSVDELIDGYRGYYCEWGVAEGECGNNADSVLMLAFAIGDQCPAPRVDNETAKIGLSSIAVALERLYIAYRDPVFRDGRMAVATMGNTLSLDGRASAFFKLCVTESLAAGAKSPTLAESISQLRVAVSASSRIGFSGAARRVLPESLEITFEGLETLATNFRSPR